MPLFDDEMEENDDVAEAMRDDALADIEWEVREADEEVSARLAPVRALVERLAKLNGPDGLEAQGLGNILESFRRQAFRPLWNVIIFGGDLDSEYEAKAEAARDKLQVVARNTQRWLRRWDCSYTDEDLTI